MRNPYRIDGPALISFSGGRTSGYMLRQIQLAHGGELPADVIPVFANTGCEMPETLDFVRDCGERWDVKIRWLEYRWLPGHVYYAEVDHATASREGEPFDQLITARSMLPNPVARFCTAELKIRTMERFAKQTLGLEEWTSAVGLRADEQKRVAKMRARMEGGKDGQFADVVMPLHEAKITKRDVGEFWSKQNFDLRLPSRNGQTAMGNCTLCFLKSKKTVQGIMRERPWTAKWWIYQESRFPDEAGVGAFFTQRHAPYAELYKEVLMQRDLGFLGDAEMEENDMVDCICGDNA